MKATILIFSLTLSQLSYSARTCKPYIPDEWPDSRYVIEDINGDNIVTDSQTGLMWKQCSQGLSGSDCNTGTLTTHTWQQALDLASTEDFAGFNDWRVPNQKELRTIVARNCYNPSINEIVFPNTPSNWFWSSSPVASYDDGAWIVYFGYGYGSSNYRGFTYRVRLVRSLGQ